MLRGIVFTNSSALLGQQGFADLGPLLMLLPTATLHTTTSDCLTILAM
jgi:hypothetical protein